MKASSKRLLATAAALALALTGLTAVTVAPAAAAVSAVTGPITGLAGKCMDVAAANSANGTQVQLYTCNGTAAQSWTVGTDGTIRALGKCLDVRGGVNANGTRVQIWDCAAGNTHQQWSYDASTKDVVNPDTGRCLDVTGQSTADGTPLQIWSCSGQTNQDWNLPGTPPPPSSASLVASPESLAFGNQLVGTTGPQVSVNITNEGTAAATFSGITVTGQFTRAENCGGTLAAGATCQVTTSFQPTSLGPTTGAITISSNATNPTLVVNLSGTGVNPTPPTLNGAPPSITFPDTIVGATVTRQLYLANSGSTAAAISSITASGAGFTLGSTSCGTTLPGGTSCFVNVVFAPATAGAKSGAVTVASNATNPVLTFSLTGLGVAPGATNLALGKPATGTSVPGHSPGNAVDSDLNSYWESNNNAFPQSITVDLGANASLSSIVLRVPAAWGSRNQTLSISGSTGSGFTTIVSPASYLFGTGAGNVVTIPLPSGTTARQVRITFTANTGWPAGQLSDLQIIGVFA